MKQKTIVITGSEGKIGKYLSVFFKKKNFNVIGLDTKVGKHSIKCDITKESQVKKKLNNIFKKNQPDILINAASLIPKIKPFKFSNYNSKEWRKSLEVDLIGSFYVTKKCCEFFEKKNLGLIINFSSIYGIFGADQSIYGKKTKYVGYKKLEYSVSKAGVIGFTKSLSSFYKNTGIKVFCFILGGVEVNIKNKNFSKLYFKKTVETKFITTEQICKYIDFCISNPSTISGSCISINGGADTIL